MSKFQVGDKAHKTKGYEFPCTIVSVFATTTGNVHVVAEMDDYGLLHIFNEDQLEQADFKNKKVEFKKIELLNFEGPVLEAHCLKQNTFAITDEWKNIVAVFTKNQFFDFIEGNIFIKDSKGRTWVYKDEHPDAKPDSDELVKFILGVKKMK